MNEQFGHRNADHYSVLLGNLASPVSSSSTAGLVQFTPPAPTVCAAESGLTTDDVRTVRPTVDVSKRPATAGAARLVEFFAPFFEDNVHKVDIVETSYPACTSQI